MCSATDLNSILRQVDHLVGRAMTLPINPEAAPCFVNNVLSDCND